MRETKLEQHVKKAAHSHKGEKQNSSTGTSISERLLLRVKRVVLTRGKGRSKGSILTVSKAHSLVCFFLVQSKLAETIHPSSSMISLLIPNIIQLSSSIPSLPATPLRLLWKQPLLLQRGGACRRKQSWVESHFALCKRTRDRKSTSLLKFRKKLFCGSFFCSVLLDFAL